MTVLELPPPPEIVLPRYRSVPHGARGTYGDEAIDLARLAGLTPDPEQCMAIHDQLSFGPGGKWLALESIIKESRQNGKTDYVVMPVVIWDLWMMEPDEITWTAQLFRTSRKSFEMLVRCIETSADLSREVRKVSFSHGEESVELMNGALLSFVAREGGSGRGLKGKRVVFDEALLLPAGIIGGFFPTLSARPNSHVAYASSGAKLGEQSDHLRDLTARGRAYTITGEPDDSLIYMEFCAPGGFGDVPCAKGDDCEHGTPDREPPIGCLYPPCELGEDCPHTPGSPRCALDNPAYVQQANHTAGKRITWSFLRAERRTMRKIPREYARERLGWDEYPPNATPGGVINMTKWEALENREVDAPVKPTEVALSVDISRDRSAAAIGVAWWWEGRPAVMVHCLKGTRNVLDMLFKLLAELQVEDFSLQSGGPAGSLIKSINAKDPYPELREVSDLELSQGTGYVLDCITNGTVVHLGQPELETAMEGVQLRKRGESVMWARDDLVNLSPLYAATLALNGLQLHVEDGGGFQIW